MAEDPSAEAAVASVADLLAEEVEEDPSAEEEAAVASVAEGAAEEDPSAGE